MDQTQPLDIINLVSSVGNWILFFYLFLREQKAHWDAVKAHNADLREMAGLRQSLSRLPSSDNS